MELHIYGCHDEQGPTGEDPIVIIIINTAWFACVCTLIFIHTHTNTHTHHHTFILLSFTEPAIRLPPKEIQEQSWLAETLGCFHQLLLVLL